MWAVLALIMVILLLALMFLSKIFVRSKIDFKRDLEVEFGPVAISLLKRMKEADEIPERSLRVVASLKMIEERNQLLLSIRERERHLVINNCSEEKGR